MTRLLTEHHWRRIQVHGSLIIPSDILGVSLRGVCGSRRATSIGNAAEYKKKPPQYSYYIKNSCRFVASTVDSLQRFRWKKPDEERSLLSVSREILNVSLGDSLQEGSAHSSAELTYRLYSCLMLSVTTALSCAFHAFCSGARIKWLLVY